MNGYFVTLKRNIKLFFKDKAMFLTSLITPAILLVLYVTFLKNVYRDSFSSGLPAGLVSDKVINGLVGGQLISSILAVSCVTVSFCSNFLMVQDKANGTIKDMRMSPVRSTALAMSYYAASFVCTMIICLVSAGLCFAYVASVGWYMTVSDILLVLLDMLMLVLFGTALSSIINFFLSSQGQISAVGSIVSSGYGFICGAYMPIYSFGEGLRNAISLFPGTYGTSLLRKHTLRGAFEALESEGVPVEAVEELKDIIDCNIYFFGNKVGQPVMYAVLIGSVAVLISVYVIMNVLKRKNEKN